MLVDGRSLGARNAFILTRHKRLFRLAKVIIHIRVVIVIVFMSELIAVAVYHAAIRRYWMWPLWRYLAR